MENNKIARPPKVGEVWITFSGAIIYFYKRIDKVLLVILTDKGVYKKNKWYSFGEYMVDWCWYNKTGKYDHPSNPLNELDCAKFLCKL